MKFFKKSNCIIFNSLIYFIIAYYIVAFSSNLFIILLAKIVGFDATIQFNGFRLSGQKWTDSNIILLYFFGNLFSLMLALLFQRIYRIQRKYRNRTNILFLWIYIIAISWFLGEVIVGVVFKTGISAALIAFHVPYFLRLLIAVLSILALVYFGYKTQKNVRVSANLYFTQLLSHNVKPFLINQILIPAVIGLVIIVLFKLPNIGQYHYVDILTLSTMALIIGGLFIKAGSAKSITFISKNKKLQGYECTSSLPLTLGLIICLIILKLLLP